MVDVVVIGAGAAGIGAGRGLAQLGISHVILESKQRVGGRAYTDISSLGQLWDHGCHWFHSADINVLRTMADKLGHGYRKTRTRAFLNTFIDGVWHNEPAETAKVWTLLEEVYAKGRTGPDVAVSALIPADLPRHVLAAHWFELMSSQTPGETSSKDAGSYNDTGHNLAVGDGYGALIARLAEGLPVKLATAASVVRVTGRGVEVETSSGTIAASACIVAVPARSLETGRLRFVPGLPPGVVEAANAVPMGYYEKIAIGFARPIFEGFGFNHADVCDVAGAGIPINFELNPFGRPIAVGHIAGPAARQLAEEGQAAMVALAEEALMAAFGADIRKEIMGSAVTSWTADPWINGAYSCARPGKAHLRANFSLPVHDRVFLAGEHVHTSFMATAHGAYETGFAAAAKAARLLGHANAAPDPLWLSA